MNDWLTKTLEPYEGPWPPYPGFYPALLLESSKLLSIFIWDKDISKERLYEEVVAVVVPEEDMVMAVHFGTPDEIADYIKKAQDAHKAVVLDTTGMKPDSQREFAVAGARHNLGMLTIKTGEEDYR